MKKIFIFMVGLIFIFSLSATAQDRGGFGLKLGYFDPSDSDFDDYYGGGLTFGLNYLFPLGNDFNLETALDYFSKSKKFSYEGYSFDSDITIMPVTLTLRYQPCVNLNLCPFFGAGLGYYYVTSEVSGFGDTDKESESDFGYHAVAGMDYKLGSGSFLAELKWASAKIGDWDDAQVGGLTLSAGYRFTF